MSEKNAVAVRWEVLPDPARSTERIAAGLLDVNRDTAEYGLVLSPDEARELAEVRTLSLAKVCFPTWRAALPHRRM